MGGGVPEGSVLLQSQEQLQCGGVSRVPQRQSESNFTTCGFTDLFETEFTFPLLYNFEFLFLF